MSSETAGTSAVQPDVQIVAATPQLSRSQSAPVGKLRTNATWIWKHAHKVTDPTSGKVRSHCNYCTKSYLFLNSNTHTRDHLIEAHRPLVQADLAREVSELPGPAAARLLTGG